MENTLFSRSAVNIIKALKAGEPVSNRAIVKLRDELDIVLKDINKKLFTADHGEWAKAQLPKTGEVVDLLASRHFQAKERRVGHL